MGKAASILAEKMKIYGVAPNNYTGAAMTAFSVSLKYYDHITYIITTGAWAAGTAAVSLTQDTSVTPTASVKALGFSYQWTAGFQAATGLVKTAVVANTFNLAAANQIHVIEVDAATLDVTNGFDVITLVIASPGANNDYYGVNYLLSGCRYAQATPPDATTD